jgi:hypothetical protein
MTPMPAPSDTLRTLYDAFAAHDGEAMAACYAPDARFEDPVFTLPNGEVGDMWRMLNERGSAKIEYRIVDDAHVEWTADYVFEGHPVHNEIRSAFEFGPDGKITKQVDTFDFPRWAGQALGLAGKLLGRFGFFRNAVRKKTAARLASWRRRRAEGESSPG